MQVTCLHACLYAAGVTLRRVRGTGKISQLRRGDRWILTMRASFGSLDSSHLQEWGWYTPTVPAASSRGEMDTALGIWAVLGYDLEMITFSPCCRVVRLSWKQEVILLKAWHSPFFSSLSHGASSALYPAPVARTQKSTYKQWGFSMNHWR